MGHEFWTNNEHLMKQWTCVGVVAKSSVNFHEIICTCQ